MAVWTLLSSTTATKPSSCRKVACCCGIWPSLPPDSGQRRMRSTRCATSRKVRRTAPESVKKLTPPWLKPTQRTCSSALTGSHAIAVAVRSSVAIANGARTISAAPPGGGGTRNRLRCWPQAVQLAMTVPSSAACKAAATPPSPRSLSCDSGGPSACSRCSIPRAVAGGRGGAALPTSLRAARLRPAVRDRGAQTLVAVKA
mmetsp:Transcript_27626/g.78169  ORF Transcript_27626/g.78169 Transcript_27626/m.78169 type:complete len:201 (+) Transcript_27626:704-1306(+)